MDFMTLEDVMEYMNVSRPVATRLLKTKGCPLVKRVKGGRYLVPREAFISWVNHMTY